MATKRRKASFVTQLEKAVKRGRTAHFFWLLEHAPEGTLSPRQMMIGRRRTLHGLVASRGTKLMKWRIHDGPRLGNPFGGPTALDTQGISLMHAVRKAA